jgi:imidazolonepropionase-like amidohydrolase
VGQARTTVRQILGRGADFIKVIATGAPQTMGTNPGSPELTEDEIRAAVEIATEHGVHVAAHAHGAGQSNGPSAPVPGRSSTARSSTTRPSNRCAGPARI